MAVTETEPETTTPDDNAAAAVAKAAAQAAKKQMADQQLRVATSRWLTTDTLTTLGQHLVSSIDRYQQVHGKRPTWAEALAGVDEALLSPIRNIPTDWPTRPAFWRIELRQRLMIELRRTRWIAYNSTPRSLQPGDHGRGWLRNHPTGTATPHAT